MNKVTPTSTKTKVKSSTKVPVPVQAPVPVSTVKQAPKQQSTPKEESKSSTPKEESKPSTLPKETEAPTADEFNEIQDELYRFHVEQASQHKLMAQRVKRAQRLHNLEIKEASKKQKKVKAPRDYSKPKRATGFAKAVVVSDELYTFLTKNKATMKEPSFVPKSKEEDEAWPRIPIKTGVPLVRTDVTSFISKYVRDHNLQNPTVKREIMPDATLKKIFANPNEPEPTTYSYLQLQRYISHHFKST
jgi:uncharacterized membrane-anchored protein YhcB (DUF1043 family)